MTGSNIGLAEARQAPVTGIISKLAYLDTAIYFCSMRAGVLICIWVAAVVIACIGLALLLPNWVQQFQALLGGLLAFLAGATAIIGAWFGAKALARQTADVARHRIQLEEEKYRKEARSIAMALAGELHCIIEVTKRTASTLSAAPSNKIQIYAATMQEFMLPDPVVFRSVTDRIGYLPPATSALVARTFHNVIEWNNSAERLRENTSALGNDDIQIRANLLGSYLEAQGEAARQLEAFSDSLSRR